MLEDEIGLGAGDQAGAAQAFGDDRAEVVDVGVNAVISDEVEVLRRVLARR